MDNLFVILAILILVAAQIVDKKLFLERESKDKDALLDTIAKLQTALTAKSAQEYVGMRAIDKVLKEEPKPPSDRVDASELSDEEYQKMINVQNEMEVTDE